LLFDIEILPDFSGFAKSRGFLISVLLEPETKAVPEQSRFCPLTLIIRNVFVFLGKIFYNALC